MKRIMKISLLLVVLLACKASAVSTNNVEPKNTSVEEKAQNVQANDDIKKQEDVNVAPVTPTIKTITPVDKSTFKAIPVKKYPTSTN